MPIQTPAYQLSFDLDLPEDESNAALNADEIQARKDIARAMLESPATWPKDKEGKPVKPFWFEHYLKLSEGRWPFRVAVMIAWLATPKKYRWPKTQDELADLLGMSSDRQFTVWRARNPHINTMIHEAWKERVLDGLSDSIDAMLEVAARPDYKGRGDRELHYKMADVFTERFSLSDGNLDFSKMTFKEKLNMAGLDSPEALEQFRKEQEEIARRAYSGPDNGRSGDTDSGENGDTDDHSGRSGDTDNPTEQADARRADEPTGDQANQS